MSTQDSSLSKFRVGVTTVAFSKNQWLVNELNQCGFGEVKTNVAGKRFDRQELIDFLSDCDAAIVGLDKVDGDLLDNLPKLKVISKYGVGLDNIDLSATEARNVVVTNAAGVNKRSVAEMALGFMLGLARNLYKTSNLLKEGTWEKNGGFQLSGKTVGIIGVGHIGKDLCSLLAPFDCKVILNDIIDISSFCEQHGFESVAKEELFQRSDFVSIHTPLTKETHHLIDRKVFEILKPSCILINTARGEIVNLNDLKHAMQNDMIGGAGLDVYDVEPPNDKELISIKNLINTPHIGGNSAEAVRAMGVLQLLTY